jgi:hypothetical protein
VINSSAPTPTSLPSPVVASVNVTTGPPVHNGTNPKPYPTDAEGYKVRMKMFGERVRGDLQFFHPT